MRSVVPDRSSPGRTPGARPRRRRGGRRRDPARSPPRPRHRARGPRARGVGRRVRRWSRSASARSALVRRAPATRRYSCTRTRSEPSTSTTARALHAPANAASTAAGSSRCPNGAVGSSMSSCPVTSPDGTVPSSSINAVAAARRGTGAEVSRSRPSPFAITARLQPARPSAPPNAPTLARNGVAAFAASSCCTPSITSPAPAARPVRRVNTAPALVVPSISSTRYAAPAGAMPSASTVALAPRALSPADRLA